MKQTDINGYSDDELRQIWWRLERNEIENLPYKIGKYILTDNPGNGNEMTRKVRVKTLIGVEVEHRFMRGEIQTKIVEKEVLPEVIMTWLEKRIGEIQLEYNAIDFNDCQDEFGNITDYTIYSKKLTTGGRLTGYKQCRDYILTHKP